MKRSPLKRSTKRMRKLRPAKARARAAFRKAVLKKNKGWCVRCRYSFGFLMLAKHPHHWLPVGRGGTDDPDNGLPMCSVCHRWIHDNPEVSENTGYLLVSPKKTHWALEIEKFLERVE